MGSGRGVPKSGNRNPAPPIVQGRGDLEGEKGWVGGGGC